MLDQKVEWFKTVLNGNSRMPDDVGIVNIKTVLDTMAIPVDRQTMTRLIIDYDDGMSMRCTFEIYDRHQRVHEEAFDRANTGKSMPYSIARHLPDFIR